MVWKTRSSTTDKTELKESWLGENPNQETWSMQWKSASRRKKTAAQPCNDMVMSQFTVCQCAARGCSLSAMISNHLLCGRLPRVLHMFAYFCIFLQRWYQVRIKNIFCIFLYIFAYVCIFLHFVLLSKKMWYLVPLQEIMRYLVPPHWARRRDPLSPSLCLSLSSRSQGQLSLAEVP